MIIRIIRRSNNKAIQLSTAKDATVYFLGRRVDEYIVIKSDRWGDRVVILPFGDALDIEDRLNRG